MLLLNNPAPLTICSPFSLGALLIRAPSPTPTPSPSSTVHLLHPSLSLSLLPLLFPSRPRRLLPSHRRWPSVVSPFHQSLFFRWFAAFHSLASRSSSCLFTPVIVVARSTFILFVEADHPSLLFGSSSPTFTVLCCFSTKHRPSVPDSYCTSSLSSSRRSRPSTS